MRKPEWVRSRLPGFGEFKNVKSILEKFSLNTVCESALCPNIGDCWAEKSATIMIMGEICTRNCRFCSVKKGKPYPLDPEEPSKVAMAIKELGIEYAVITSVTRDDLDDGGANHFYETVKKIKEIKENVKVEVLIPDFNLKIESLKRVLEADPDVIAHNVEVVERLTPFVRDKRAGYKKSIEVLKIIKELNPRAITKSSIMIGMGENKEEIIKAMEDIKNAGCEILTIGQYLQPKKENLPVVKYYTPDEFKEFEKIGKEIGFKFVVSGVFVRSSYKAKEALNFILLSI